MGDNSHPIKSKVWLVMVTTENPEKVLLTTFLRRVPVHVKLPDFASRPIDERLELLRYIFYQEARRINRKIEVDKYIVSTLLKIKYPGNIVYLKNIIKISCASAYRDQENSDVIKLHLNNIMVEELPTFAEYGNLLIDSNTVFERSGNSLIKKSFLKLEMLLKQLETNYSHEEISKCKLAIQNLKCFVDLSSIKSGLYLQHNNLFQKIIENQFGLANTTYLESVLYLLYSYHFEVDEKIIDSLNEKFSNLISRSLHVAKNFYSKLPILVPQSQKTLELILALLLSDYVDENIKLRGLMVAHGENTATSIQNVVNSLCGTYIFDALDMPIDTGVEPIIDEAKKLIASFNTTEGFILMVDMGSLGQLYSEIKYHLDGDLLVVNNLTTLTSLDLALKMQQNISFKQISEAADRDYEIGVQYYEGFSQSPNILVSCISGLGDSIFWGVLRVIAAGVGISLASQGSILGPILFLLIYNIPSIATRYYLTYMGFTVGDTFIQDMYKGGSMKLLNKAASTLGLLMIGCMTATMVKFESKLSIPIEGGKPIKIQTYLDQLWVGLVTLVVTLICYWLL